MCATSAERTRLLCASGTFEAVAAALRTLGSGPDDRVTRLARELEGQARAAAEGLRAVVAPEDLAAKGPVGAQR